jgi:hypothetical protein
MEMTDTDYCDLMSYTKKGSNVFRVKRDLELFYLIQIAIRKFRQCLIDNVPPDADESRDLSARIQTLCQEADYDIPAKCDFDFGDF